MKLRIMCVVMTFLIGAAKSYSAEGYKVNGQSVSVDKIYQDNLGKFFELEKQKYDLIKKIAVDAYLKEYWKELGSKKKITPAAARAQYFDANAKVSESEIKATIKKFGDHPQLKSRSDAEKRREISQYLKGNKEREAVDRVVDQALRQGKLVISYPKPADPVFPMEILPTDPVKYGPKITDTKPIKCKGEDCAITVVEYSEYQCPFCVRVLPAVNRLLSEYSGKVRWIVRDFPLGFHDRAKPAAVAARCAQAQGKFWEMYDILFKNQRKLGDDDLKKYGKTIGLSTQKYEACLKNPGDITKVIDKNYALGESVGVTGTPAFFINGRRLSGALPYESFKEVFEEEFAKLAKNSKK